MIYMTCITTMRWARWRMVLAWFGIHMVEECVQIFFSIEGFMQFVKEVWNAFDFLRLVSMVAFIYYDYNLMLMENTASPVPAD